MFALALLLLASGAALQPPQTTVVLGHIEKDLTGDGEPEVLRVVGTGPTIENLDVTFTIESAGKTLYRYKLHPFTRWVGFEAGRHMVSREQHRARLKEFGSWFFADQKFQRPGEFVNWLNAQGRCGRDSECDCSRS